MQKENEVIRLCGRRNLNEHELNNLRLLLADESVKINYAESSNAPLMLLCNNMNQSASVYAALQVLMERKDLEINSTNPSGYNALMILCSHYSREDFWECAELLINRGINVDKKNNSGRNALQLFCINYRGENLIYNALRLASYSSSLGDSVTCRNLLYNRKNSAGTRELREETKIFENLFVMLRSGRSAVSTI